MKPITHALIVATTFAGLACSMMPSASAACGSPRTASTFGSGTTAYWLPTAPGDASLQSWQLGAPATWQGTGCDDNQLFPDLGGYSLFYNISGCGAGCPASFSTLVVLAQIRGTSGTSFLLDTVVETPERANNFDYGPQGDHTMIPIPRPRVVSSANAGACINITIQFDSIEAGLFGPNAGTAVTGFRLLKAAASTDPGRDPAAYTLAAVADAPGGTAATTMICLPCAPNPLDQWLVTQISFENGSVLAETVGAATRVRCESLADPKPRIVPKRLGPPTSSPD